MSYFEDKGCLLYGLFFLWLGIACGIPSLIFESNQVGICGIIGISIALGSLGLSQNKDQYSRINLYSFSFYHLWLVLAYIVVAIITIGWCKVDFETMKELAQCSLYYLILLVIVFGIEVCFRSIQEKRFMEEIKVGDLFEESNVQEKVLEYVNCDLAFIRSTLWKVYKKDVSVDLVDVRNPKRKKKVYYSDLLKMSRAEREWYRTPNYYEYLVEVIKKRGDEEYYGEQNYEY